MKPGQKPGSKSGSKKKANRPWNRPKAKSKPKPPEDTEPKPLSQRKLLELAKEREKEMLKTSRLAARKQQREQQETLFNGVFERLSTSPVKVHVLAAELAAVQLDHT